MGQKGITGEDGALDLQPRLPNDDLCFGMQDEPEDYTRLRQTYHNLVASDPFPAEEPPESALPNCPAPPPTSARLKGARDVAFGDSYISGEGAPKFIVDRFISPMAFENTNCHVALTSWVALAHYTTDSIPGGQAPFQHWACSGARIADAEQQATKAIAQAKTNGGAAVGLGINTAAVQISVGGNDVRHKKKNNEVLTGLGEIATCAVAYGMSSRKTAAASDCLPTDEELSDQQDSLVGLLDHLYDTVGNAAPNAIIEVVGYPKIFSDTQVCTSGLVRNDEIRAQAVIRRLDIILRRAVEQAQDSDARRKVRYIAFDNALARHNACPTGNGNTHGINVPNNSECDCETVGYLHPNREGHKALLAAYIRLGGMRFPRNSSAIPTPSNGTLIADASSDSVFVAAGGALFPFIDPADITAAGYAYQPGVTPQHLDPGQIAALSGPPAQGTVLRDAATGAAYRIVECGLKTPTQNTAGAVTLPSHSIAGIPDAAGVECPEKAQVLPMATAISGDRLWLFALREDHQVWARAQSTGGGTQWNAWFPIGDRDMTTPPTAVVHSGGVIEVYALGTDSAVYRTVQSGPGSDRWSGWLLAGPCCIQGRPSAALDNAGRINLFGLGFDNQIYVTTQTSPGSSTWTGWQGLGGYLTHPPLAVNDGPTGLFVVARNADSVWYRKRADAGTDAGTWAGWTSIGGGPLAGQIAVAPNPGTGRSGPQVYVRQTDNKIYARQITDGGYWVQTGDNTFSGEPFALVNKRVEVVGMSGSGPITQVFIDSYLLALGTDQKVYISRMNGCDPGNIVCLYGWSPWQITGQSTFLSQPVAGYIGNGKLQAFDIGADHLIYSNVMFEPRNLWSWWYSWNSAW